MNRPIKFRAYSHRSKRMWGWSTLTDEEIGEMLREPNQEEIMQFTGLLDKQGVEIYEGDVIEDMENKEYRYVVEFIGGGFHLKDFPADEYSFEYETGQSEVIGNIYENPELIEDK